MKKFFAIALLTMMVGLGTPAVFADGNAESPGITSSSTTTTSTNTTTTVNGTAESPGVTGSAESPGLITDVLIYLNALV